MSTNSSSEESHNKHKLTGLARQVGIDFGAALTVALAFIRDRLGIFKTMSDDVPRPVVEVAADTGLNQRDATHHTFSVLWAYAVAEERRVDWWWRGACSD